MTPDERETLVERVLSTAEPAIRTSVIFRGTEGRFLLVKDEDIESVAVRCNAAPLLAAEVRRLAGEVAALREANETEILRRIDLDRVGREKALDLLNKGFESCCEDRDRLKQQVRTLTALVKAVEFEEWHGAYCNDVAGVDWFKARAAALAPASPPE